MKTVPIVVLGEGQAAYPNECGSCHFFKHRQEKYDTMGRCKIKFPPWLDKAYQAKTWDGEIDIRTVGDRMSCDFWKPKMIDGIVVEFEQVVRWKIA